MKMMLTICTVLIFISAFAANAAERSYRIAVMDSPVNNDLSIQAKNIVTSLTKSGFDATFINISTEWPADYDCVIVADSQHFPESMYDTLRSHITKGRDIVLMGGRSFADPVKYISGKWYSAGMVKRMMFDNPASKIILSMENSNSSQWTRNTNHIERPSAVKSVRGFKGKCIQISIRKFQPWDWDVFSTTRFSSILRGSNVLSFMAKASGKSAQMWIEIAEKDNCRWKAVVKLTAGWKKYALSEKDFSAVDPNDPVQRPGGHLKLDNAAKIGFGIASEAGLSAKADTDFWVDNLGVSKLPITDTFDTSLINELPVFGTDYNNRVQKTYTVRFYNNSIVRGKATAGGAFSGQSAVCITSPSESEFIPILAAYDKYNRKVGWASGLLINYAGKYENSNWLVYGINESAFYGTKVFLDSLKGVLKAFKDGDLPGKTAALVKARLNTTPEIDKVPKFGRISLSKDGKHLVGPDGKRFFVVGANYLGYFDRVCFWDKNCFDPMLVESDFKRAHEYGINTMRIWIPTFDDQPEARNIILTLAQKYGIYLLIHIYSGGDDMAKIAETAKHYAQVYKNSPMVLGFDLRNEPQVGDIAGIRTNAEPSPLLKLNAYERFAGEYDSQTVENRIKTKPGWPVINPSITDPVDLRNIYAAIGVLEKHGDVWGWPVGKKVSDAYNESSALGKVLKAVNDTFDLWITPQIQAIKGVDPNYLVTIGYDHPTACLPTNKQLDFVAWHSYGHSKAGRNVDPRYRMLDIQGLAQVWTDIPLTMGEFGLSTGDINSFSAPYTDEYSASISEMAQYLSMLADGYDGAMKWQLNDWPIYTQKQMANWVSPEGRFENERYGLFGYDGTPEGRPKPAAYAIKMLRMIVDRQISGGKIRMFDSDNAVHAGYEYMSGPVHFVGTSKYSNADFSFVSDNPVNVMLIADKKSLTAGASSDVNITLDISRLLPAKDMKKIKVDGKHGEMKLNGNSLNIYMLAGEILKIR